MTNIFKILLGIWTLATGLDWLRSGSRGFISKLKLKSGGEE